jgi:hypothetical protein
MNVFEFLSQSMCDIVGHNWRHDFQTEGKILNNPERRDTYVGKNILNNTMGIFFCVRCGKREFRVRENNE